MWEINKKRWIVGVMCLLWLSPLAMAIQSPVVFLNGLSQQMLVKLQHHKSRLSGASGKRIIYQIVNQVLMPHMSSNRMSAAVVGRNNWLKASRAQRATFIKEFKQLVISTYGAALTSYDNDRVRYYPLRGGYASKQYLRVNSVIIRRSGQKIPVSYNLLRAGNRWQIYDFSVENVSMVQSYRSSFASYLSKGGMNGLIKRLKAHNRRNQ